MRSSGSRSCVIGIADPEVIRTDPEVIRIAQPEFIGIAQAEFIRIAQPQVIRIAQAEFIRIAQPASSGSRRLRSSGSWQPEVIRIAEGRVGRRGGVDERVCVGTVGLLDLELVPGRVGWVCAWD